MTTTITDWRGAVGDIWAEEWRRTDRSFAALSVALDAAVLAAAPAERAQALDIGCGAGATSLALAAARPDLAVLGIDISAELADVARERANRAGLANVRFATVDLDADLPDLPAPDLLFSRHGVMFCTDPRAMFVRLRALARPGARLVFSCFRSIALNPWAGELVNAVAGAPLPQPTGYVPGPFAFADPDFVTSLLQDAGWHDIASQPVDYEYLAGAGADPVADAAAFFSRIGPAAAAMGMADDERQVMRERLVTELARHRDGDRVAFPAAAWLWSASA